MSYDKISMLVLVTEDLSPSIRSVVQVQVEVKNKIAKTPAMTVMINNITVMNSKHILVPIFDELGILTFTDTAACVGLAAF